MYRPDQRQLVLFRDISDRVTVWRSFLQMMYITIAAVLIFSCFFNAFYEILPAGTDKSGTSYSVLSEKNKIPSAGEAALIRDGDSWRCVMVLKNDGSGFLQCSCEGGRSIISVPLDRIEGRVKCIVAPLTELGKDSLKLC